MYLDTAAHSIYRDYRFVIGVGASDARRALKATDDRSIFLHVWRNRDGIHATYSWYGSSHTVHGREDAITEVVEFPLGRAISTSAREAIEGWIERGARAELALVLQPVND